MALAARLAGLEYGQIVRSGSLWARVMREAAEQGGLDVLSACSDPVREAHDLGAQLVWFDDDPPAPDPENLLLAEKEALRDLDWDIVGPRMEDRLEAIFLMKEEGGGEWPVLGWVEGPSSLGAVLRGMTPLMEDLIDDPDFVADLFDRCAEKAIQFARLQVEAGADMIGMGDAPSSLMGPRLYGEFVLPREKRIIEEVHRMGVGFRLHICGNTSRLAPLMDESGADLIDLDFPVDLASAVTEMPRTRGILGNLDPVRQVLNSTPSRIAEDLSVCRQASRDRFVVGAGCEIPAKTPLENLRAFCDFAQSGFCRG